MFQKYLSFHYAPPQHKKEIKSTERSKLQRNSLTKWLWTCILQYNVIKKYPKKMNKGENCGLQSLQFYCVKILLKILHLIFSRSLLDTCINKRTKEKQTKIITCVVF